MAVLVCLLAGSLPGGAQSATRLYKEGRQAEQQGHFSQAYLLYSQAAALEPTNPVYWARSQALRTRAMVEAKVIPTAELADQTAAAADPALAAVAGKVTEQDLAEARRPQPPKTLKAAPGRKDFDLQGDAKTLFEKVAQAFGLETVFDGEYPAGRPFRFRLEKADYREALRALEAATGSFVAPLSERLLIVAKDNPQKRLQVEPTAAVTIPLPEPVSVQEAQELARAVQQVCDIRKLFVDSARRLVFLRDAVSKVRPAEALFAQLLRHRTQVVIEVQFLEVSKTSSLNYGLSLPTQVPLAYFGNFMHSVPSAISGFASFAAFGGGKALLGLGVADAQAIANLSKSDGQTLMEAQLRTVDGQAVSFHVGDKYPITTGYYTSGTASQTTNIPPAFNFEDLGLVLKLTPHVHGAEEVTLDTEAEFKVLTGQSLNGIPIISDRKFLCQARLRMGEWAVVSGIMTSTEARTMSGIAGLASLPVLGPLLRQSTKTREDHDALLLLRPLLLSLPASETPAPGLWVGAETRFRTPL